MEFATISLSIHSCVFIKSTFPSNFLQDSPGFKSWSNNYDDHAPLYYEIYLYNITNLEELKNGGRHINTTILGPYMYWYGV